MTSQTEQGHGIAVSPGVLNTSITQRWKRVQLERELRHLCSIGYLDRRPDTIGGSFGSDAGTRAAIEEFLLLHELEGFSAAVRKEVHAVWNANKLSARVLNWETQRGGPGETAREGEYRLRDSYGRLRLAWGEIPHVEIQFEGERPQEPIDVEVEFALEVGDEQILSSVGLTMDTSSGVAEFRKPLMDAVPEAKRSHLPVACDGELRVWREHPRDPERRLCLRQKVMLHRLKNIVAVQDDKEREWFLCDCIAQDFYRLKAKVNGEGGGKLVLNSTLRTWSKQMELWARYRRGTPGQNPANQPGTSWHETGRAIDISVWALGLDPATLRFRKRDVEKAIVDTQEGKDLGSRFLAQLDLFRRWALEYGFTLAGERWKKIPWNRGYPQFRSTGSVVETGVDGEAKFMFRMELDSTSSRHLNRAGVHWVRNGEVRLDGGACRELGGYRLHAVKRRGRRHGIELQWIVLGRYLEGMTEKDVNDQFLDRYIRFEWKQGRREYSLVARVRSVAQVIKSYRMKIDLDEPVEEGHAMLKKKVVLTENGARSLGITITANELELSPDRESVEIYMASSRWQKYALGTDPGACVGWRASLLVEDRRLDTTDTEFSAAGRFRPAFQAGKSEKHHFQNKNDIVDREGWESVVDGLNEALEAFRERVKKIEEDYGVPGLTKRWSVRDYSKKSSVLRGAAYIYNLPEPAKAHQDFQALADEIELECQGAAEAL